jgi:hypothetical protein
MGVALLMAVVLADVPPQDEEAPVPPDLSDAEIVARAETAFREGMRLRHAAEQARPHFHTAAVYYEELRSQGVSNALLFRNLGNAHLMAGDLPNAILAYRRGLLVAPHNHDLQESLSRAREKVIYQEGSSLGRPLPDVWPPWLPHLSDGSIFGAAVVLYALAWVAGTRWLMVRRGAWLGAALGGLFVAAVLASLTAYNALAAKQDVVWPLVVIADDGVLLRKGNGLTYPPRYETPVNRGVEARLLFERGEWLQIELAGGAVGWVSRRYVLLDAP